MKLSLFFVLVKIKKTEPLNFEYINYKKITTIYHEFILSRFTHKLVLKYSSIINEMIINKLR